MQGDGEAMALNAKQRQFALEYIVDFNAKQAAIRAGYSAKTAEQTASRLLRNVKVQAAVEQQVNARAERTEITADRVLEELAKLGFSNMLDYLHIPEDGDPYVHLGNMTRDQAAAVQEVTVEDFKDGRGEDAREVRRIKFKLADKKSSLELLGKHLKLFTDKVEHTGTGGGPIRMIEVVETGADDDPAEDEGDEGTA